MREREVATQLKPFSVSNWLNQSRIIKRSVIHFKFTIIFPLSADSNGTGEADAKLKIDLKGKTM